MLSSPAVDDYLKAIFSHTEWQDAPITPSQLAVRLGLSPSSVTEMVKRLAAGGLVAHTPYRAVRLTDAGTARAVAMVRRHRLIETWLVRRFGYTWDEVHEEAEVLEHAFSDRLLARIDAELGFPRVDPHGDPIPAPDGSVERAPFVLLRDAPAGHRGAVLRVSDQDPELLRELESLGMSVGTIVESRENGVLFHECEIALPPGAADAVWLEA